MFAARNAGYWERGPCSCPGQRTSGWQRARCSLGTESVTNHTLDVREGEKTTKSCKNSCKLPFIKTQQGTGAIGEQFNVLLGRVPQPQDSRHVLIFLPPSGLSPTGLTITAGGEGGREGRRGRRGGGGSLHILFRVEMALSQNGLSQAPSPFLPVSLPPPFTVPLAPPPLPPSPRVPSSLRGLPHQHLPPRSPRSSPPPDHSPFRISRENLPLCSVPSPFSFLPFSRQLKMSRLGERDKEFQF